MSSLVIERNSNDSITLTRDGRTANISVGVIRELKVFHNVDATNAMINLAAVDLNATTIFADLVDGDNAAGFTDDEMKTIKGLINNMVTYHE